MRARRDDLSYALGLCSSNVQLFSRAERTVAVSCGWATNANANRCSEQLLTTCSNAAVQWPVCSLLPLQRSAKLASPRPSTRLRTQMMDAEGGFCPHANVRGFYLVTEASTKSTA